MPLVLLVIDLSKRELFGSLLLKHFLESLGNRALICNSSDVSDFYDYYRPDAIVYPNALSDFSDLANDSLVFVLPSESGNGQRDQILSTHGGTPAACVFPKGVTRFFCWGLGMKDILMESGTWSNEQLIVTGSPATDHWTMPLNKAEMNSRAIGITPSLRALSNNTPPKKMNYYQWIDQTEQYGANGNYFRRPEHAESWLFFEASFARAMCSLIRELSVAGDEKTRIRPHPNALIGRYKYFKEISGGKVTVSKAGTISNWLERTLVLFTFASASSLDAIVRGVPVVSMRGLIDPDALRKIPVDFHYPYEEMLWQLDTVAQAQDYIGRAKGRKLDVCSNTDGLKRFLAEYFSYPRSKLAAEQIAEEIDTLLRNTKITKGKRTRRQKIKRSVPFFAHLRSVWRFLYSLLPGKIDIGYSYHFWKRSERRATWEEARKVINTNR